MNCEEAASYRKVLGFTPDRLLYNTPRICVATVMKLLDELYIKYEGYFSLLVFIIDSYSHSLLCHHIRIYTCMYVCMYVCTAVP